MKPKILIYTDWFPPAYKAGGPVQSIYQLTQVLKHTFDIYVLTTTEDLNSTIEDQLATKNSFVKVDGIQVNYLDSASRSLRTIKRINDAIKPDFTFFNGIFKRYFHIHLLAHLIRRKTSKTVISLRGMLRASAIQQKKIKKRLYLQAVKWLSSQKNVSFHCTTEEEERDMIACFGKGYRGTVIPNIPFLGQDVDNPPKSKRLSIVYAARIHPIKNLHLALGVLARVRVPVKLTIIGVVEDEKYWLKCQEQIKHLPEQVEVEYGGDLTHTALMQELLNYDVYFLPTQGENFGHSIFEALSAGLPVIISDQTPWKNLEAQKVGFDIPLNNEDKYVEAIEFFAQMDQETYASYAQNAMNFARNYYEKQQYEDNYKKLFETP